MAAIFSSSVCAPFISDTCWGPLVDFDCFTSFDTEASALCEFLEFCGILPETYLAAPPLPAFAAGRRFAITVVDRGMMVVSSSYSTQL